MDALESYYGNPRAIWGKCKHDLENAVGNFQRDWGTYGTQKRVMAIARTEDFIREAEMLAKEFSELENEIYSSGTTALLSRVLPKEYSEKVNDTIADVNSTEQQKLDAIKKFLEIKIIF